MTAYDVSDFACYLPEVNAAEAELWTCWFCGVHDNGAWEVCPDCESAGTFFPTTHELLADFEPYRATVPVRLTRVPRDTALAKARKGESVATGEGLRDWLPPDPTFCLGDAALWDAPEHVAAEDPEATFWVWRDADWYPPLAIKSDITLAAVKAYLGHHRHNKRLVGWKFGAAAVDDEGSVVGVVSVGRPVARMLDHTRIVEINRLCSDGSRNVPSMLYGWAVREARKRKYQTILTYTLASEPGTSLVAAGFVRDKFVRGRSWHGQHRPRVDKHDTGDKWRWRKELQRPRQPA